jgi:Methyltransferase small domain
MAQIDGAQGVSGSDETLAVLLRSLPNTPSGHRGWDGVDRLLLATLIDQTHQVGNEPATEAILLMNDDRGGLLRALTNSAPSFEASVVVTGSSIARESSTLPPFPPLCQLETFSDDVRLAHFCQTISESCPWVRFVASTEVPSNPSLVLMRISPVEAILRAQIVLLLGMRARGARFVVIAAGHDRLLPSKTKTLLGVLGPTQTRPGAHKSHAFVCRVDQLMPGDLPASVPGRVGEAFAIGDGSRSTGQAPIERRSIEQGSLKYGLINEGFIKQGLTQQGLTQQDLIEQGLTRQGLTQEGLTEERLIQQGSIQQELIQQELINELPVDVDAETLSFATGPYAFSSGRLDLGSRLLIEAVSKTKSFGLSAKGEPGRVADLACGNGVVGIMAHRAHKLGELHFSDVSYSAVALAERNATRYGIKRAEFKVDSGFDHYVGPRFDAIVLNPPFHHHGGVDEELGAQLFGAAHGQLRVGGELWVVGNRHLGYQKTLQVAFGDCRLVTAHPKFVVLVATRGATRLRTTQPTPRTGGPIFGQSAAQRP